MMKTKTLLHAVLLVLATSLFAGDGSGEADEAGSQRSPSPDGAAINFSNLSNGDVVPPVFTAKFSISGMGIAPAGVEIDNTGHHHLLIDVQQLPDFNQPLPATNNIRHFGKGESETELRLPEGEHTLQLVLADYEHIPHQPPVVSEQITIVVSANAPEPAANEDRGQ